MAAYGRFTQLVLKYNTENLMEADEQAIAKVQGLTLEDVAQYAQTTTTSESETTLSSVGSTLIVASATAHRQYFRLDSGSIEDYMFLLDGQEVTPVLKGGLYYVELADIPAALLTKPHSLVVKKGESPVISIEYCALSYVYNTLKYEGATEEMKNAAASVYFYAKAASEYFNVG